MKSEKIVTIICNCFVVPRPACTACCNLMCSFFDFSVEPSDTLSALSRDIQELRPLEGGFSKPRIVRANVARPLDFADCRNRLGGWL